MKSILVSINLFINVAYLSEFGNCSRNAFCKNKVTQPIYSLIAKFVCFCYILAMTSFTKTPFPYAGCKYNLMEELEKAIPPGETLVDMFGGSGVVAVNLAHTFGRVIYTDIM